jgi:methylmalonyl-CoA mutase
VAKSLKGRAFDSLVSQTLDGIALQPLYRGATEPAPVRTRVPGLGEPPWTILQRLDIPDVARAGRKRARTWRTVPAGWCWSGRAR